MTITVHGDQLERAVEALRAGELVAFPTETVYGLGANALDARAVAHIFEAKGRPHFDPLIVHLADIADAQRFAATWPRAAQQLGEAFWPGPLTIVVEKSKVQIPNSKVAEAGDDLGPRTLDIGQAVIPDLVTAGLPTVALRVPGHAVGRALIERAGVPVAAPSANRFGGVSPTRAEHVLEELGERVSVLVDGGPCETGVESTVVSVVGCEDEDVAPTVLRLGGLPVERIEAVLGPVAVATGSHDEAASQAGRQSPGMLGRHYAPATPLVLTDQVTMSEPVLAQARASGQRVGVLLFQARPQVADELRQAGAVVEMLSASGDLPEAAAYLFATIRRLDAAGVDVIIAEAAPEAGLGRAINDRLRRAAAEA